MWMRSDGVLGLETAEHLALGACAGWWTRLPAGSYRVDIVFLDDAAARGVRIRRGRDWFYGIYQGVTRLCPLVSIPLSALSLRLMDVLPVQSYGRTWFLPQDFRILPRLCFPGGFSFTDGSNVKLVKDDGGYNGPRP